MSRRSSHNPQCRADVSRFFYGIMNAHDRGSTNLKNGSGKYRINQRLPGKWNVPEDVKKYFDARNIQTFLSQKELSNGQVITEIRIQQPRFFQPSCSDSNQSSIVTMVWNSDLGEFTESDPCR